MNSFFTDDLIYPEEVESQREKKNDMYKKISSLHMYAAFLFTCLTIGITVGLQDSNVIPTTSFPFETGGPVGFPSQQLYFNSQFNPVWFIVLFVFLAAVDHSIIFVLSIYRKELVKRFLFERKNNPIRWIEYSLSASFMLITICILCGITDIHMWVLLGSSNCIGMLMGQLLEMLSAPLYKDLIDKKIIYYIFSLASGMVFIPWMIPMCYFFYGVSTTSDDIPSFVYIALFGVFVCFSSFAVNSYCYHCLEKYDFYTTEYIYVILSFVAKTILALDVYGGLASIKNN
jgi:hypothetical protein